MALPGFIRHILGPQRFPRLQGQDLPVAEGDKTPLETASACKRELLKPEIVQSIPKPSRKPKNGIRKRGDQ